MDDEAVAVLIVDDLPSFRAAATATVAATRGFRVAGIAGSGEEALSVLERSPIGLVLMDVNMPGMGGAEAATRIRTRYPGVLVVLLSVGNPPSIAGNGIRFIPKSAFGPEALEALWDPDRSNGG